LSWNRASAATRTKGGQWFGRLSLEAPEWLVDFAPNLVQLQPDIGDQTRVSLQQLRKIAAQTISRPPSAYRLLQLPACTLKNAQVPQWQECGGTSVDI
jgi:hypothetical protein